MAGTIEKQVYADAATLATEVARRFATTAAAAIQARGKFTCALTGGSAAKAIYGKLAGETIDWSKVHLFWGDERAVPHTHADSNFKLAHDVLLDKITIPAENVHRMKGEAADLTAAAHDYADLIGRICGAEGALDVIHNGVGPDGHICSLFPGHKLLTERTKRVMAISDSPKPPPQRMTLTLAALAAARECWFLVTGAEKAVAVAGALGDPKSTLPAALATRGAKHAVWLVDRAAAEKLGAS